MNNLTAQQHETIFHAFLEAALWLEPSMNPDDDEETLEDYEMHVDCRDELAEQCRDFAESMPPEALDALSLEQIGPDFYLTRQGHGAGFWDRGIGPLGDALTDHAKAFGELNLYIGDDGMIHGL